MIATAFTPIPVSQDQLAALRQDLIAISERLEASGSADWFPVARAAAVVDGLRTSVVCIQASPEEATHGAH